MACRLLGDFLSIRPLGTISWNDFIQEDVFEKYVCKRAAISSRGEIRNDFVQNPVSHPEVGVKGIKEANVCYHVLWHFC